MAKASNRSSGSRAIRHGMGSSLHCNLHGSLVLPFTLDGDWSKNKGNGSLSIIPTWPTIRFGIPSRCDSKAFSRLLLVSWPD